MMRFSLYVLPALAALVFVPAARADGAAAAGSTSSCSTCGNGGGRFFRANAGFNCGGHCGGWFAHGHGAPAAQGHGFGWNQPPFQAAPWYLYYPYDQHFQLPAPIGAPYYAPQVYGNPAANPYFGAGQVVR